MEVTILIVGHLPVSAFGGRGLMGSEELTHLVDRLGEHVRLFFPGIDGDLGFWRQLDSFHRSLVRVRRGVVRHDEHHCTGQKIRIADIVDKYDVLVPSAHSRVVSRLRVVPLACLGDLTGCFGYDQIHSEKRSWLDVDAF